MLGAAAALALPRVVTEDTSGVVDKAVVRECRAALQRLYELDDRLGGADVYALTVQMVKKLRNTLARASYRPRTGQELREVTAATAEHAAWLAFDAGSNERARGWWLEALLMADMGQARDVRVAALASMALQAASSPNPADGREAVDLIRAARTAAGADGTPRLYSLLAAREALGHARAGDERAAVRALGAADRLLEREPSEADPPWLSFWGEADLASHQTRVAVAIGDLAMAERVVRRGLTFADETTYPRNYAFYNARLGNVLARAGKLEEAISVMTPLVSRVNTFGSNRLRTHLRDAVDVLDQHQGYRPVRQFSVWSRKLLGAA
jgi:hypothetical protein